jgi:hypothetical protein
MSNNIVFFTSVIVKLGNWLMLKQYIVANFKLQ